ncbi:MAG TPA: hypothetical protein DER01_20345 [Phycisphaerales bacterium]|nr:hypothetical protein [Phycisphaerales bacterium]
MNESAYQHGIGWPKRLAAWAGLLVITLIAYASSYGVPFVFDDVHAIVENPSIRHWQSFTDAFTAPDQSSFAGRPVVNLSFALQTGEAGKLDPARLHGVNNFIHVLNAILLFELLVLVLSIINRQKLMVYAFFVCTLWVIHPLNTEAVVYLTQRTELFVTLFFLISCYASVQYMSARHWSWLIVAVIASALGMGSKENMVGLPVMVLLINWVLFNRSIKRHWKLHLGLALTWLILLWLNISGPRDASAGMTVGISSWQYLLTQSTVIPLYLRQVFTADHLSIVHDWPMCQTVGQSLPWSLLPLTILALTVWGVVKKHPLSLAGVAFFLILGPTSSIIPIATETVAERRMYLPSAMVIGVVVLLLGSWCVSKRPREIVAIGVGILLTVLCIIGTQQRLEVYQQPRTLWEAAISLYPNDGRALNGLGYTLIGENAYEQAIPILRKATEVDPEFAESYDNLGLCYLHAGKLGDAKKSFEQAIALNDSLAKPYNNLGITLARLGELDAAVNALNQALARSPHLAAAHLNLGMVLNDLNRFGIAAEHLLRALPMLNEQDQCTCLMQLARAALGRNELDKAMGYLHGVLQIQPDHGKAKALLGKLQSIR